MSEAAILTGAHFMNGDEACAEGAIAAGCRFFAGYPITPATEIAERMSERLPAVGGVYIQMEDELASISAVLGAAWGGALSMTATSGPGFSLMMENLGLGIMTETPCVLVNVQRGGPSTGLPTAVGQADMMQARWGSHGHYEIIALVPASPQELFDLTVHAFQLAETYRTPVLIMTDEVVGHMTERVVIPPPEQIPRIVRRKPSVPPEQFALCRDDDNGWPAPPMPCAGDGYHVHVTGLTHDERGYPLMAAAAQEQLITRLARKISDHVEDITLIEEQDMDDAEVVIVAYGISARTAHWPMMQARQEGIRVGLLKLVSVWPFPEARLRDLARRVRAFVVPELNLGQIAREVERCAGGQARTIWVTHPGGDVHPPERVLQAIREAAES